MSFSETIFLFFLALIIFGPKKLPEIARMVGKAMNEFRRASNEFKAQIEQEIAHLEVEKKQTILPPSPTPEGTTSRTLSAGTTAEPPASESSSEPASPAGAQPAQSSSNDDEPGFANQTSSASQASSGGQAAHEPSEISPRALSAESAPTSEAVTSSTSQESHA